MGKLVKILLGRKVFMISIVLSVVLVLVGIPWYLIVCLFIIVNGDTWSDIDYFTTYYWISPMLFILLLVLWVYIDYRFVQ